MKSLRRLASHPFLGVDVGVGVGVGVGVVLCIPVIVWFMFILNNM